MKRFLLLIFTVAMFCTSVAKVSAYVVVTNSSNNNDMPLNVTYTNLMNPNYTASGGQTSLGQSPWLYGLNQYVYLDGGTGQYLSIDADYYLRIDTNYSSGISLTSYINNSSRNTINATNLRCAVGGLGSGYDSSSAPTISNFGFEQINLKPTDSIQGTVYRVHFVYNQKLSKAYTGSQNVSCWFERNPSNGLFAQVVGNTNIDDTMWTYYHNARFNVQLTSNETDRLISETNIKIEQVKEALNTMKDAMTKSQDKTNSLIESDSDDTESGSCGIICKLKGIFTGIIELPVKLVNLLVNALKSLFIPDDMDFIYDFLDTLENKLGFIGEVPSKLIKFGLDLVGSAFDDITSLTLPQGDIFGYTFWEGKEIDISPAMVIITPIKYLTDILCVTLCVNTIRKWKDNFTGGGS